MSADLVMSLAGSELREVRWEHGDLVLDFSAAWVQPARKVMGQGDQHGFQSGVTWRLSHADVRGSLGELRGRIAEGSVDCAGVMRSVWPMPDTHPGVIVVSLQTVQGVPMQAKAQALLVQLATDGRYFEPLAC